MNSLIEFLRPPPAFALPSGAIPSSCPPDLPALSCSSEAGPRCWCLCFFLVMAKMTSFSSQGSVFLGSFPLPFSGDVLPRRSGTVPLCFFSPSSDFLQRLACPSLSGVAFSNGPLPELRLISYVQPNTLSLPLTDPMPPRLRNGT